MDELLFVKKLLEIGDKEGAIKELGQLLRQHPSNIEALFMLGQVVDEPEKKADCYRYILKIDPTNKLAEDLLIDIIKAKNQENTSQQQTNIGDQSSVEKVMEDNKNIDNQTSQKDKRPNSINRQTYITSQSNSNLQTRTKFRLSARYLTALFGLGVIISVAFPWYDIGDFYFFQEPNVTATVLGFEAPIGILTLICGIAIVAVSIFRKTLPLKPASPISSIISLVNIVFLMVWFDNYDMSHVDIHVAFFVVLLCLIFSYITGLGINPGQGIPDWSTYVSLLFMGLSFIAFLIIGNKLVSVLFPSILFALCPGLLLLFGILTVIIGRKKPKTL